MGHLTTGFLGTPALTRMLSDNGYLKEAYGLLLREEYPSCWRIQNGHMTVTVRVPPNAHGTVVLPGARLESVREGTTAVQAAAGVASARQQGDDVLVEVGSGDYEFTYPSQLPQAR